MGVKIFKEYCKSCGLCINICPAKILKISREINLSGYNPVEVTAAEDCRECGFCYLVCPDAALLVEVSRQ